ncbi:MAG: short-chain dehydrogenase/reductase [Solirubrobacteraceae bacterium]|jgi:NAD(P)-dependent dehydrogenase (short-subunit alcohol dehydrogenase family)
MATYEVRGRIALVTGAARGIGYETARRLHQRGASVALVDLDPAAVEAAASRIGTERTLATASDVTDVSAIEQSVSRTVERFGGVDIVVANAGIAPAPATVRVVDPAVYERVIEVDLLGVWRTVRACLPAVVERGGHVVVVASIYAFLNGVLGSSYAISKAGVEQFGRALRVELAPHGASASVAYFGFIATEMTRGFDTDPLMRRHKEIIPDFLMRRVPPATAADAIVRGIERRSAKIIAPRAWHVFSALRGILNPLLDARMERDGRLRPLIRDGDRPQPGGLRDGAGAEPG